MPVSSHPTDTKLLITQKAKKQDMDIEGHKDIQQIPKQQASLQTMMQSYEKKGNFSRKKGQISRLSFIVVPNGVLEPWKEEPQGSCSDVVAHIMAANDFSRSRPVRDVPKMRHRLAVIG